MVAINTTTNSSTVLASGIGKNPPSLLAAASAAGDPRDPREQHQTTSVKKMAPSSPPKAPSLLAMLWPCALYFGCAFAMNMLTKVLLTTYQWRALYTLGAIQNTFTMASVLALLGAQALWRKTHSSAEIPLSPSPNVCLPTEKPRSARRFKLPALSYVLRVMLPLVTLHVGNMILGFASMRVVNMPMYLVLRRLTTLKVMLIEWLVLHKEMSTSVKLALLLSTLGSIIAGSTDATADLRGYALVLLQNVCSACSLTFSKESALSSIQLVLLNSAAGSVICSLLAFQLESETVVAFPDLLNARFLTATGVMCCVCVLYQFSIFICTLRNSALATSVTGNVKDLVSTVCGFLFFPDAQVRASNVAGVVLSFIGAYSFSYLKYLAFAQAEAQVAASERAAAALVRARGGGGRGGEREVKRKQQ